MGLTAGQSSPSPDPLRAGLMDRQSDRRFVAACVPRASGTCAATGGKDPSISPPSPHTSNAIVPPLRGHSSIFVGLKGSRNGGEGDRHSRVHGAPPSSPGLQAVLTLLGLSAAKG